MSKLQHEISLVEEFHQTFQVPFSKEITNISIEDSATRFRLMEEENLEYKEAAERGDIVEIADALGDQLYILCGTIIKHGMQNIISEVFEEIHHSNMTKLDENGHPIFREDGKILKGPNYCPPNIMKILFPK